MIPHVAAEDGRIVNSPQATRSHFQQMGGLVLGFWAAPSRGREGDGLALAMCQEVSLLCATEEVSTHRSRL